MSMSHDRLWDYLNEPDPTQAIEREAQWRKEFEKTDTFKAGLQEFLDEHGQEMLSEAGCSLYQGRHFYTPHMDDDYVECYFCGVVLTRYT